MKNIITFNYNVRGTLHCYRRFAVTANKTRSGIKIFCTESSVAFTERLHIF